MYNDLLSADQESTVRVTSTPLTDSNVNRLEHS